MASELQKVGATVEEGEDYIRITPPQKITTAEIETYDDHRMAMCFALLGLRLPDIRITNTDCVSKSYPTFFEMLARFTP